MYHEIRPRKGVVVGIDSSGNINGRISDVEVAFKAVYDAGGHRFELSNSVDCCFTASYRRGVVACYNLPCGRLRWTTKIPKLDSLLFQRNRGLLFCGRQTGSFLIDPANGDIVERGLKEFKSWEYSSGYQISVGRKGVSLNGTLAWDITKVLAVAVTDQAVYVSGMAASVKRFSWSGTLEDEYSPPEGAHVLRVFGLPDGCMIGGQWPYMHGGPVSFIDLATGVSRCELDIGRVFEHIPDSYMIVDSNLKELELS